MPYEQRLVGGDEGGPAYLAWFDEYGQLATFAPSGSGGDEGGPSVSVGTWSHSVNPATEARARLDAEIAAAPFVVGELLAEPAFNAPVFIYRVQGGGVRYVIPYTLKQDPQSGFDVERPLVVYQGDEFTFAEPTSQGELVRVLGYDFGRAHDTPPLVRLLKERPDDDSLGSFLKETAGYFAAGPGLILAMFFTAGAASTLLAGAGSAGAAAGGVAAGEGLVATGGMLVTGSEVTTAGAIFSTGELAGELAAVTFVQDVPGYATNLVTGEVTGGAGAWLTDVPQIRFVEDVPGYATDVITGEVTGPPPAAAPDVPQIRFVEDVPGYATDVITGEVTGGPPPAAPPSLPGASVGTSLLDGAVKTLVGLVPGVVRGLLPGTVAEDHYAPPPPAFAAGAGWGLLLLAGLGLAVYVVVKK